MIKNKNKTCKLPSGVGTEDRVMLGATQGLRKNVLQRLGALFPSEVFLCPLYSNKAPRDKDWNHLENLLSANDALMLNLGLSPNGVTQDAPNGFGLVAARLGCVALDVDGEEAISFLEELGLWEQVLEATEGFSWTSGKPHRFQVLVSISDEVRDLLAAFPDNFKPDATNALDIRHGLTIQSALPGSRHSQIGEGSSDEDFRTYQLISSNAPKSLGLETFWAPLVRAYEEKKASKPKASPVTSDVAEDKVALRVQAIRESSLFASEDEVSVNFSPTCHASQSGASGRIYKDSGALYCLNCGSYTPEMEQALSDRLSEEGIKLPAFSTTKLKSNAKDIEEGMDSNATEKNAPILKAETKQVKNEVKPVHSNKLSKKQRQEKKLLETLAGLRGKDATTDALISIIADLNVEVVKLKQNAPRFSATVKRNFAQGFLEEAPIIWVDEEEKFYEFLPAHGVWGKVSLNSLAGKIRSWVSELEGYQVPMSLATSITDFLIEESPRPRDGDNAATF